MLCGASKRKITPSENLLPDLRGLGDIVFTEALDDIYVRTLILGDETEKILFVVFDLDKVPYPEKYLQSLSQCSGIPEANIALLSIHTHTAPVTGWRPSEGKNFILNKPAHVQKATREYEAFLEQAVQEAVEEALALMQPVRIGWGQGESYVNINRVQDYFVRNGDGSLQVCCGLGQNPTAKVDRSLRVLKIEDLHGNLVACLSHYAVHNCVMIGNRCGKDGGAMLSSDLGGNVSRILEENYPGCVALWTSGAAGDVNPVMSNEIFYPDPETGKQTAYLLPPGDTAPCMMLKVLAARHYADVQRVLERIVCSEENAAVGGMVEWSRTPGKESKPYEIRAHLMRIGGVGMWGVSGELYSSLGAAVIGALPEGTHMILNHDASLIANTGYIYDDETIERDRVGMIPGRRKSAQLPGYVKDSLISISTAMWNRMNKEG